MLCCSSSVQQLNTSDIFAASLQYTVCNCMSAELSMHVCDKITAVELVYQYYAVNLICMGKILSFVKIHFLRNAAAGMHKK